MNEQHDETDKPTTSINVNQQANDVRGKQIGVEIDGNVGTVTTGFSAQAVQRLVITIGVLVFVTAACFFSGGIVIGIGAFAALNRPVATSPQQAADVQRNMIEVSALKPGQRKTEVLSESALNSYVNRIVGPQAGLSNARARMLDEPGRILIAGNWSRLNNVPVALTFKLGSGDEPLELESAAAQLLPLGNAPFGWVAIPNALVEPTVRQLEGRFFTGARVESVRAVSNANERTWAVNVVKK